VNIPWEQKQLKAIFSDESVKKDRIKKGIAFWPETCTRGSNGRLQASLICSYRMYVWHDLSHVTVQDTVLSCGTLQEVVCYSYRRWYATATGGGVRQLQVVVCYSYRRWYAAGDGMIVWHLTSCISHRLFGLCRR